jgi:NAD(P)-dependent dehydrogenase (short-subunit alcohol dehydrogenase family)
VTTMSGKTCLVTGGIGKETAVQVAMLGATVIIVAVRGLAEEVRTRYDRFDVLVNNAGVIMMRRQLTAEGLETNFANLVHF